MDLTSIVLTLSNDLVSAFGNRLRSILWYGSSSVGSIANDLDLLIILRGKPESTDTKKFRKIREGLGMIRGDFQLIYESEILDADSISLDGHGSFISLILSKARVVHGDNPFIFLLPRRKQLAIDILQKIQCYVFRARQEACGNPSAQKDKHPDIHRKKIRYIMQDILLLKNLVLPVSEIEDVFNKSFPNIPRLSKDQDTLSIDNAIPFYEALYELARFECNSVISNRFKPARCRIDNILFEVLHNPIATDCAVVLCDGLPGSTYQEEIMMRFSGLGYHVVFPRYQGTWESGGSFLAQSPTDDIRSVCDVLVKGIKTNQGEIRVSKIILIGTSFGGSVAIEASNHPSVVQTIALSPVCDIPSFQDVFLSLKLFLTETLPGAYRFDNEDWQSFMRGEVVRPENLSEESSDKVIIFAGENDLEIPVSKLKEFCTNKNICLKVLSGQKHLSFSKVRDSVWQEMMEIIQR